MKVKKQKQNNTKISNVPEQFLMPKIKKKGRIDGHVLSRQYATFHKMLTCLMYQ